MSKLQDAEMASARQTVETIIEMYGPEASADVQERLAAAMVDAFRRGYHEALSRLRIDIDDAASAVRPVE